MEKEVSEVVKSVMSRSMDKRASSRLLFKDKRYKAIDFSKTNFKAIPAAKQSRLCFIDGGNNEIIGSEEMSIQLVRAYACVFMGSQRIMEKKKEFFVHSLTSTKDDGIFFESVVIGNASIDPNDISLDSYDSTITQGGTRASVSKTGELARCFAELSLASEMVDALDEGSIIVLDGTLQSIVTNESKYRKALYEKAAGKKIIVCAVAKSSRLFTDTGASVFSALGAIAPEGEWMYWPLAEISHPDHPAEIIVAKLHKLSNFIFRIDLHSKDSIHKEDTIACLAGNSNDFAFPGYPYGMIVADQNARVTQQEKEYYRTIIESQANIEKKKVHDILDTMAF